MIIAIPVQESGMVHTYGPVNAPPPRLAYFTWWHWYCTTCCQESRPRALFDGPRAALEMGDYHQEKYGCRPDGQQSLFA